MTCPKKGAKNISSALNQTAASPILYAKRDRIGPKGEGINSIATNPREVDQIARRAWKAIYDGNFENLDINAEIFMKQYDKHIFTMERPFKVDPITADEVAQACKNAKASVAGLDNWEPAEFAMLNEDAYAWIAALLNSIEDGFGWPDGTEHARAAYLSKDCSKADDPLCYRVLLILPTLNRIWGSIRLDSMKDWTDQWGMNEFYAGTGNQGAEDAWFALAGEIEHYKLCGEDFVGGAVDIAKCFDQVSRPLLYRLAEAAGMPPSILSAYKRFQENLKVHNTISKGIGMPYNRKCGIPQGCPLSMMYASLIMRPWMMQCKATSEDIEPKILADDILALAHGKDCLELFRTVLDQTHQYIEDMGGKLAEGKSINFATNPEHKKWLKQSKWKATGKGIEVVSDFRYLGSHCNVTGKAKATTNINRIKLGILQTAKLKKLPIDRQKKANTLRTKIYKGAFYGTEVVQIPERQLADITTAVLKVLTNKGTNHDLDSTFAACSWGDDLDPVIQLFVQQCMTIRRAVAKRPHKKIHYQNIFNEYLKKGSWGTTASSDHEAQAKW